MLADKQLHFLAGATIAATVGVAKELYDRAGYGTPDIKDFIATALGATVVLPAILL